MGSKKRKNKFQIKGVQPIQYPKPVQDLYKVLGPKNLYVVGGAVRDGILGEPPIDYDFATPIPAKQVINILRKNRYKCSARALKFGTVFARKNHERFEITTFYSEKNEKGLKALESDAWRRDFTINSLYAGINGKPLDPTGLGYQDLLNRTIRFVDDPLKSIKEDDVRLLRALRLHSGLGFGLEKRSRKALYYQEFHNISKGRLRGQFEKIITGPYFKNTVPLFVNTGLFDQVVEFSGTKPVFGLDKSIEILNSVADAPNNLVDRLIALSPAVEDFDQFLWGIRFKKRFRSHIHSIMENQ